MVPYVLIFAAFWEFFFVIFIISFTNLVSASFKFLREKFLILEFVKNSCNSLAFCGLDFSSSPNAFLKSLEFLLKYFSNMFLTGSIAKTKQTEGTLANTPTACSTFSQLFSERVSIISVALITACARF